MKKFAPLLLIFLFTTTSVASAAQFEAGEDVSIAVPVNDDLYIAGSNVKVKERIIGDLYAVGMNVSIEGNVAEDLNIAGRKLDIIGNIGGDLRVAGNTVLIRGDIGEDLIVFGGTVRLDEGSVVRGDVILKGGTIDMKGSVREDMSIEGNLITCGGIVQGEAEIRGTKVWLEGELRDESTVYTDELRVSTEASIQDNFRYWTSEGAIDLSHALQGGSAFYDPQINDVEEMKRNQDHESSLAQARSFQFVSLLIGIILIGLLILCTKKLFTDTTKYLLKKPGYSVIAGFLFFLLTPIASPFIIVTFVAAPIGIFLIALWILCIYLSSVIAALVLAKWTEHYYGFDWNKKMYFVASAIALLALKLLHFIPLLGSLAVWIIALFAFGAMLLHTWTKVKKML
jgi:hypothetical protein